MPYKNVKLYLGCGGNTVLADIIVDNMITTQALISKFTKITGIDYQYITEGLKSPKLLIQTVNSGYINLPMKSDPRLEKQVQNCLQARKKILAEIEQISVNKSSYSMLSIAPGFVKTLGPGIKLGEMVSDREIMLALATKDGMAIGRICDDGLAQDLEIGLAAVKQNADCWIYLSQILRNNPQVAMIYILKNPYFFQICAPELRSNRDIVLSAVKQYAPNLLHADPALYTDRDIMLSAVKQDGLLLILAAASLQNDKQVVLNAVCENGNALKFASLNLRNDQEIVLSAITNGLNTLEPIGEQLRNEHTFMLNILNMLNIDDESNNHLYDPKPHRKIRHPI